MRAGNRTRRGILGVVLWLSSRCICLGQQVPKSASAETPFIKLQLDPPSGEITCLGFSATRNIFFAGALNSWVHFWSTEDWHKALTLKPEPPPEAKSAEHQHEYRELTACAISQDGSAFPSGSELKEIRSPADALAYGHDGRWLAAGYGSGAEVWDTSTWAKLRKLNFGIGTTPAGRSIHAISALDFSPGGNLLAVASDKGLVNVWNMEDVAAARLFRRSDSLDEDTNAIAFSPDGRFLAGANWGRGAGRNAVYVWRTDSGDQVVKLEGHRDNVWAVAFSPDGRVLASGDVSGTVRFWAVGNWKELCSFSAGSLYAVAYSPDSKWFVTGGGDIWASIWKNPPCQ